VETQKSVGSGGAAHPGEAAGVAAAAAGRTKVDSEPVGETQRRQAQKDRAEPGRGRRWSQTLYGIQMLYGALTDSITDRMSLAAAGCAYYATLALFPAISSLVSVYGLMFNPAAVEQQLLVLRHIVPAPAYVLIEDRIRQLVIAPSGSLSIGLAVSFVLTFWSASTGTRAVLSALNVAHDEPERRGYVRFQLTALTLTVAAVLVVTVGIALLVFMPAVLSFVGLSHYAGGLLQVAAAVLLIGLFGASLAVLYRLGPSRPPPPAEPTLPGVVLATALWLIASLLLSWYVANIRSFGATYGPLGAVVGIMLWFWVAAYAALLGAELNVRLGKGDNE
jgi:membrane protein